MTKTAKIVANPAGGIFMTDDERADAPLAYRLNGVGGPNNGRPVMDPSSGRVMIFNSEADARTWAAANGYEISED